MLSIRPGTDILDCVCGATGDEGDMVMTRDKGTDLIKWRHLFTNTILLHT